MLTIGERQTEAFSNLALTRFEDEMLDHLRSFAPELHAINGDEVFRVVIHEGIERGMAHGFTLRGPLRFFTECMFSLGYDFDTDPQYPWVEDQLSEREEIIVRNEDTENREDEEDDDEDKVDAVKVEMQRSLRLFEAVTAYRQSTVGSDNQYARSALKKICTARKKIFSESETDLTRLLLRQLQFFYPEKASYVGDQALVESINEAQAQASLHGISSRGGMTIVCVLMLVFGHGVLRDPLYAWIGKTLQGEGSEEQKVSRLTDKTWRYLEAMSRNWS